LTPDNFYDSLFHCDKKYLYANSHRILKEVLEFHEGELGIFCFSNQIFLLQHKDISLPSKTRVLSKFNFEKQGCTEIMLDFQMKRDIKINYSIAMLPNEKSCAVIGGISPANNEIPDNYILSN